MNVLAATERLTSFVHLKPKSDTNSEQKLLFDSGAAAAGVHSGTHSSSPKKHSGRPSHFRAMMKRKVPSMLKHFRRDSSAWVRITIFGYLPPPGNTNKPFHNTEREVNVSRCKQSLQVEPQLTR